MRPRTILWSLILSVSAFLYAATTYAEDTPSLPPAADTPREAPAVPQESLAEACEHAKADFHPITQTDVAQAKEVLVAALGRLDEKLTEPGANGEGWRKYLHWDVLQDSLRAENRPNLDRLTQIHAFFTRGYDGLELAWFLDVQHALQNYIVMASVVGSPQVRTDYESELDKLAPTLKAYAAKPTTEDALVISESVRWLQNAHQAPALVQAIQDRFVHPNVIGHASAGLVGAGIVDSVDDVTAVNDCILGTSVVGTAHTVGKTSVVAFAQFGDGRDRHPVLRQDPQRQRRLSPSGDDLQQHRNQPGRLQADVDQRQWPVVVSGGLQRRNPHLHSRHPIVQGSGDWSSEWPGNVRESSRARPSASPRGTPSNGSTNASTSRRPNRSTRRTSSISRSTSSRLAIEIFSRSFCVSARPIRPSACSDCRPAAASWRRRARPRRWLTGADMTLQLHESAINNLAFDALAGRTIYEDKVQAAVKNALGHLPESSRGTTTASPGRSPSPPDSPSRSLSPTTASRSSLTASSSTRGPTTATTQRSRRPTRSRIRRRGSRRFGRVRSRSLRPTRRPAPAARRR